MTGQGHATEQGELGTLSIEVRTVNNRGFKCSTRMSDSLGALENQIETLTRSLIHRGSVSLSLSWRKPDAASGPAIDTRLLTDYAKHLQQVRTELDDPTMTIELSSLLSLPGVLVLNREVRRQDDELWGFVKSGITAAIENLDQMRQVEGAHMAESLRADAKIIHESLDQVRSMAPQAVETYRQRLETKIDRIFAERNLQAEPADLLREVQIYADRADVSEEITRLDSHLKMFENVLAGDDDSDHREPTGRKLDFIIQEMFRETNTIGSKASDAGVSAAVVEIKCAIERMRELVQNLE